MPQPTTLRLMLDVKRRRLELLREELARQTQELQAREARRAQAHEQESRCRDDEQACAAKIAATIQSSSFLASDVVTLGLVLGGLRALTTSAAQGVSLQGRQRRGRTSL